MLSSERRRSETSQDDRKRSDPPSLPLSMRKKTRYEVDSIKREEDDKQERRFKDMNIENDRLDCLYNIKDYISHLQKLVQKYFKGCDLPEYSWETLGSETAPWFRCTARVTLYEEEFNFSSSRSFTDSGEAASKGDSKKEAAKWLLAAVAEVHDIALD